jgi:putative ABC transport system permease protein
VRGALLVLAICALASVVAIRAALRVDPATAIGG